MGRLYTSTPSPIRSLIWTALAESSRGRKSWVDVTRTDLVPLGTTEILCSRVQPSLTGLIGIVSDFPGLRPGLLSTNLVQIRFSRSAGVNSQEQSRRDGTKCPRTSVLGEPAPHANAEGQSFHASPILLKPMPFYNI